MPNLKTNSIKISLIVAVLSTSSVFAGQIITDSAQGVVANKQSGFGGWNLENVDVKIVDLNDPHYNIGTFNSLDGTYSPMTYGQSFESDITSYGTVLGRLHGKDWPLGEPTGIKVIHSDKGTQNGKPENCIMTTSYLFTGYLNTAAPVPNTCSGPHKSHKRFKIDMLKGTYIADNAYGKSMDLVFNLQEGDSSSLRFQIFQKINNYTGKRLNGYKIEVLDDAKMPNPALTFSLGYGEYVGSDARTNIWETEDLANMSHGLWGPVDDHFPTPGFFDNKRVYYPVALSGSNTVISYVGSMHGGNYQSIFGNWLPSKWHPMGIYFDADNNPNTDADLLAFWGDPLHTGVNGWHKGFADGWATPTEDEIAVWTAGAPYEIAGIEDSLNLAINYIVNVGDNTAIGSTFTIRITPHFAPSTEQGTPSYVNDAPTPNHPGSERNNPSDGKGGVPAYDNLSLLVMIFGFLGIGALIARRKLV